MTLTVATRISVAATAFAALVLSWQDPLARILSGTLA
jgi:hypothetical protein